MSRRVREELVLFSTSFLDLLFCGMSAVLLLWVLADPQPEPADPPEAFTYVRIAQRGLWHMEKVEVRPVDSSLAEACNYTETKRISGTTTETFQSEVSKRFGLLLAIEEVNRANKNGFAGRITIGASAKSLVATKSGNPMQTPIQVDVTFSLCRAPSSFHVINVDMETHQKTKHDAFVFASGLDKAMSNPALKQKFQDTGARPITSDDDHKTMSFIFDKGKVEYLPIQ